MFNVPEKYRVEFGPLGSDKTYGNNGCFTFQKQGVNMKYFVIASDGLGWEHVSVHLYADSNARRVYTPNWNDMCKVKDLFWDDEDVVMQLHPAKSQYVNNHPNTLHLWRPINSVILVPPSILVGVKGLEIIT